MPHPLNSWSVNRLLLAVAFVLLLIATIGAIPLFGAELNYAAFALAGFTLWCAAELF